MALAILDGTQTATTLSTILSSGQHITAHTVVSLGTQAITDMRSAVSGSVVSIPSLPAISGTVTANVPLSVDGYTGTTGIRVLGTGVDGTLRILGIDPTDSQPANLEEGGAIPIYSLNNNALPVSGIINGLQDGDGNIFGVDRNFPVDIISALPAGTNQIGSVTASLAISSTAITSGSFASLTSATLVPGNVARKMATVFNQGAGQLFVNAGATATTLGGGFMVALSSGDFYECDYTTTTLSAIFATAGTASWVSH